MDAKAGLKLIFNHRFEEAEAKFLKHFRKVNGEILPKKPCFRRDVRCAYALGHAVVSFILGVATFQKDQLDETVNRVWVAQELTNVDDFVGNKLINILT